MRPFLSSSLWLASTLTATTLFGQQEGESVRLDYSADPGCPNRAAFVAEVEARTPRARFDDGARDARAITVAAHVADGRARGTIDVGSGATREISAENCADIVSALALVTALVIDPDAVVERLAKEALSAPFAAVDSPSPVRQAATHPVPDPTAASPDFTPADRSSTAGASPPVRAASLLWGAGARFDASTGLADRAFSMLGLSAWLEGGVRLSGLVVPTLRLGGRAALSPTITPQQGAAHFGLLAGQIDVCPFRYDLGRATFVPCASLELGLLQATADAAPPLVTPREANRTWLALDQSLAVELAAGGPVYLTLVAYLREPLNRYDFVFGTNPDTQIASVHGVELAAGLGAGLHFW